MADEEERLTEIPGKCPTPSELGVSGWNILHSSAAVYPYKPSPVQQTAMKHFIESWAHVYACSWCAYHMRDYVRQHPPDVRDKNAVSRYVCELHNEVNERLGKDLFDCTPDVVLRRWHPGYPSKMEDKPTIEEQLATAAKQKAEAAEAKRKQQAAEEHRFSEFGLHTRSEAPREAAGWRDASSASTADDKKNNSGGNGGGGKRWWFFGSSAFGGGTPAAHSAATTSAVPPTTPADTHAAVSPPPPPPSPPSGSGGVAAGWNTPSALSQTPRQAKAADDETDVDAVLERLKRCQVYCPEDEALQKH